MDKIKIERVCKEQGEKENGKMWDVGMVSEYEQWEEGGGQQRG